jgi:hypothetical protein
MYFSKIENLTDLRNLYVKLIKKYHPDNGGSDAMCADIIKEYQMAFKTLSEQEYAPAEEKKHEKEYSWEHDGELRSIIWQIVTIPDIKIEVIGRWIWVDGETWPVHDRLKQLGFVWSRKRKKWHYGESAGYYKGTKTFEELRDIYGSERVFYKKNDRIAENM